MTATCPVCGEKFEADLSRPAFPFCTPRCKLIDLGRWLDGANNLPAEEPSDDDEEEAQANGKRTS
jgi:endogenous inhibitor of DNA gyrase (YacG/DUF329 family)